MNINHRLIGAEQPPYIIAELSANHNKDIARAYKIIEAAKMAGAHAIKLQSYRPDTITMDMRTPEFLIEDGLWQGKSLYELYEWAHMPWDWHQPLFDYAHKLGMTIFSSPFDKTAVDLLEDLDAPAYKIASFEAIDLPLIKYVAQTNKPMIISTGMASLVEIEEAVETAREGGCTQLALLHCVSGYPAPADQYNLRTLLDMQQRFNLPVGLSDHTLDNTTAIASVALGASIIEKHVTLDRQGGGPDDSFSLEPADLKALCLASRTAWQALGQVNYDLLPSEVISVQHRRSLYFTRDLPAGHVLTEQDIKSIRPGNGLAPKYLPGLLGRVLSHAVTLGSPVKWNQLA
ncbi:pseudaminic acid synthase [Thiosulfativibrio zosterae]|uniref:Pseudaminic acid synthase n=1 Tax=Thiosulfativibrio zosterae TaxID=2675053 RepID=A0A6F8PLV5_9GAMM|nr:pseudaminic acid synthase [Thiosulfativibrio zosterae]BBP43092.1 pseudaminic acid synthase [Thiosulfativibrio zosterae]